MPQRPVLRGPRGPRRNLAGAYTVVAAVAAIPFFVYQQAPRNWDFSETFRVSSEQRFPFTAAPIVATPFFVLTPPIRQWIEDYPLPRQDTTLAPFFVQRKHSPIFDPPRAPWLEVNDSAQRYSEFRPFFPQNGLNLPLQVEKWHRIEAEPLPRQSDPWGDFRPFWKQATGWTSAFNVEAWSRIEAEGFRKVSDDGWAAFRPFWIEPPFTGNCLFQSNFQLSFQGCPFVPPVDDDKSTPGRIVRHDWWKPKESPLYRPSSALVPPSSALTGKPQDYEQESARIGRQVSEFRAESARLHIEIVRLEAEINADGVRRVAEQAAIEQKLLFARQAALLVAVQEAILLEEMEVIDIAYVAFSAAQYLNS